MKVALVPGSALVDWGWVVIAGAVVVTVSVTASEYTVPLTLLTLQRYW